MNLGAKITLAASAFIVGGLVVLATPVFALVSQPLNGNVTRVVEGKTPAPEPTATDERVHVAIGDGVTVAKVREACTPVLVDKNKLLGTLVDLGLRDYARGNVVFSDAGRIKSYEVAHGDALIGIAARFCMAGSNLLYANDLHLTSRVLQPGQLLTLDPGA